MAKDSNHSRCRNAVVFGLVFLSGFAALIYQILWMKQAGLLFGNTSHAAAVTLASFFGGLAIGSWFFGRRVATAVNPMRTYALLEIGIALTAMLYFVVPAVFRAIYPALFQSVGGGAAMMLVKFALSALLVFPPAFFMGGTIPVIGQFMVRARHTFGRIAALLYGMNTLGAATGAALAGFFLPLWLGFNLTCGLAIIVSIGVAAIAFRLSASEKGVISEKPTDEEVVPKTEEEPKLTRQERRRMERQGEPSRRAPSEVQAAEVVPRGRAMVRVIAFLSGFGVLALEVLWTRLFSQVLENSVYTFAAMLVVVLLCLAVGAALGSLLARWKTCPRLVLSLVMLAGGLSLTLFPRVFLGVTNGFELVVSTGNWSSYMLVIFRTAFVTIGVPAVVLGILFPYLMKVEESHVESPGKSLGVLAAANTVGAILGAILCGFLLLDGLGMWRSLQLIALLYLAAALVLPLPWSARSGVAKLACVGVILFNVAASDPAKLPVFSQDPDAEKETLVEVWEGSDCTVAVTDSRHGLAIRINSHYSLGSTGAYMPEKFQADLPLMVYPETESVFFLGVGTGITAGSALDSRHSKVDRVVACELVPEVITAAKKYMTDLRGFDATGGLFEDERAEVRVEDGRHFLMATDERFDMINADLFVPFRSGAGSLYTKEHFENAKSRLEPGGVFVQWLPLYQLTEREFAVIARTMIEVFDQVSLWRHNFQPGDEVVALIGHGKGEALPACELDSHSDKLMAVQSKDHRDLTRLNLPLDPQTVLLFYIGNLTATRELFDDAAVNTDDRPVIEYQAPRSFRRDGAGNSPWFVGAEFADLVDQVQELCPPDEDPLLQARLPSNRRLPLAGTAFHRARIAEVEADLDEVRMGWQKFVSEWTHQ